MRRFKFDCAIFYMLVLALLTVLAVQESCADYFKYTDKTGIVNMTNDLEAVPKQYRAKALVIKEEIKNQDAAAVPARPAQSAEELNVEMGNYLKAQEQKRAVGQQVAPLSEKKPDSWGIAQKYVTPVLVVFTFLPLFIYMGDICKLLRVRQLASVLRLLMFSILIVYVYQLGVQRMTATFVGLKKDALAIKNNIEGREQRTDKILNGAAVQKSMENQ